MADFTVITTQEQLDAIIGERLKREKETVSKSYEGWTSPEKLAEITKDYDSKLTAKDTAISEANSKAAKYDSDIKERDDKIKSYETASVKTRIAHELGLSYDAISYLQGNEEESIRKSAEGLKTLMGASKGVPPLADSEGQGGKDPTKAALEKTLKELNLGGK